MSESCKNIFLKILYKQKLREYNLRVSEFVNTFASQNISKYLWKNSLIDTWYGLKSFHSTGYDAPSVEKFRICDTLHYFFF